MSRHQNCKPWEINRGPTPARTGLTKKRELQAKIDRQTEDFLANGGEVTELNSEFIGGPSSPAADHSKSNLYVREQ